MKLRSDDVADNPSPQTADDVASPDKAAETVDALLRVARQIHVALNKRLSDRAPKNISFNDVRFAVLKIIDASSVNDGCSQVELAAELGQSESSVSMLVDRMRADRLIYRLRAKSDRRRSRLILSELGQSLFQSAQRDYAEFSGALLSVCGSDQQIVLQSVLTRLTSAIDEIPIDSSKPGVQDSTAA